MKFRFQSFFDVSTSATSMQVLQFSVGGKDVLDRCRHLFGAYKYFRLGKIHVKMCPASTLPVDPLGLSYSTSDPQTVDPRDQMNPGLVRITNGEDIFTDVSSLSATQQEQVYTSMMLDPRWSKFMLQSGFRRSAYPLYWQVGQLHQDKFPGSTINVPITSSVPIDTVISEHALADLNGFTFNNVSGQNSGSSPRGLFQVGHKGRLGFLPTDAYQEIVRRGSTNAQAMVNNIPEVSVITCVLPKAFKTLYYYRIYVTEEVIFSGLRSAPPVYTFTSGTGTTYQGTVNGLDQFIIGTPLVTYPGSPTTVPTMIQNNGGDLP